MPQQLWMRLVEQTNLPNGNCYRMGTETTYSRRIRHLLTFICLVMPLTSLHARKGTVVSHFATDSVRVEEKTDSMAAVRPTDNILMYLRNAMHFNLYNPQEKVYLHFDNTGYFKGEYIRFKAYVTRCDTEKKTDLSHILYVELINPSGDVVEKRKLKIVDGEADGDIKIDSIQTTGFYEVRAYTRYMTNWGMHACFSRVFPIFRAPSTEGNYSKPQLDQFSYKKRLPNTRVEDEQITKDTYAKTLTMRFYPEGGYLVNGLKSRVAFSVTDEDGRHASCKGFIADDKGNKICDVAADTLGRGIFEFTPQAGKTYQAVMNQPKGTDKKNKEEKVKERRFDLPEAKAEGMVLYLNTLGDEEITATISNTPTLQGRLLGYALMHNGTVVRCDTLTAEAENKFSFTRYDLPEGVNQLTLFDSNGQTLSERLFFICPLQRATDSIQISSTTTKLTPCCKVKFKLQTEPNASISFSAMDAGTMNNGWNSNMKTWMLLASEVKGYIDHPEYYFEADDAIHRKKADLLMLIQGWRRYDFQLMAGRTKMENKQPIEDKLYLFGQVKSKKKKYTPDDVDINAFMYNKKGEIIEGKLRTDSLGRYNYIVPDVTGDWTLQMVSKKEDKEQNYYICIDRHFSPQKRYIYPDEASMQPVNNPNFNPSEQNAVMEDEDGYESLTKKTHLLPTVKVKAKRRVLGDTSNVLWFNEEGAQKHSAIRYNCDDDADMYADNGEDVPLFFDWLKSKNPFFDYEQPITENPDRTGYTLSTDHTTYNERPIIWIVDNTFWGITGLTTSSMSRLKISDSNNQTGIVNVPDFLDIAKSVYISEDLSSINHYVFGEGLETLNAVVFFVYQHPLFGNKQKGLRRTHFEGFNVPTAFEMEDYSIVPPSEDFRRTLYWEPNLKTDTRGRATVEFYNNSSCKAMYISAEGMTDDGKILVNE